MMLVTSGKARLFALVALAILSAAPRARAKAIVDIETFDGSARPAPFEGG